MRSVASDIMHMNTNTTSILGDNRTLFERIEDTLDAVISHGEQETATKLWSLGSGVEKSRCGVNKPLLRHEIISLDSAINISAMNTNSDSHQHMLRSLDSSSINLEQIGLLERLEPEIVVVEVAIVDNRRVDSVRVGLNHVAEFLGHERLVFLGFRVDRVVEVLDDLTERFLRLLVEV